MVPQPHFRVYQPAPARKRHRQAVLDPDYPQAAHALHRVVGGAAYEGGLQRLPEPHDVRVGLAPVPHDLAFLVLGEPQALSAHSLKGGDPSPVAEGEDGDLSLLAQIRVAPVLLHRHVEHLAGGGAVYVAALPEHVQAPVLSCQPRGDPRLDGAEVADREGLALGGHKGRPDELRYRVRHVAVAELEEVGVALHKGLPCEVKVLDVVLGQVLHLHQPPRPSARPRPVELKEPVDAPVRADTPLYRLVFLVAGLAQLHPYLKRPAFGRPLGGGLHKRGDRLLVEPRYGRSEPSRQPFPELGDAVRVVQPRQPLGLGAQVRLAQCVRAGRVAHQPHVHQNPAVIDPLVLRVKVALPGRHLYPFQPPADLGLHVNVPYAVGLEGLPLFREVRGLRPLAPCEQAALRLVRGAEEPDEVSSLCHLLVLQLQFGPGLLQGEGQPRPGA